MIRINGGQATLGANTFTGAQVAPSLALGGATIGSNALSVTGAALFNTGVTFANGVVLSFGSRGYLDFVSDGVVRLLNNAGNDFSRLQFGGTTSSFPAIKRNGAALEARLADDSGRASVVANFYEANAASAFYWAGRSGMYSPSDGVVTITNAGGADFSRLQFGGTTSSFPSIKRNSTTLNFRLADDSADAPITAAAATFSGTLNAAVTNLTFPRTSGGPLSFVDSGSAGDTVQVGWGAGNTAQTFNLYKSTANTGGTAMLATWSTAGLLTISSLTVSGATTIGGALTVPGVTTAALTSTGTFTSGAAAQVGTLTNAPAAGNPTTWIKIIDNGVTRYIPAW